MNKTVEMTASDIKNQVFRVEGFKISIQGKRLIPVKLNSAKQSRGRYSVAEWIKKSFPNMPGVHISVLFGDDRPVTQVKVTKLENVRSSYPSGVKGILQDKAHIEKNFTDVKEKLEAKKRTVRKVRGEIKKMEKQSAQEINKAQIIGQAGAAQEAIELALKKQNSFHPRIQELCRNVCADGTLSTQEIIDHILAIWSHAEKEKDRLAQESTNLKNIIRIQG